jgi:N-acetylglucosaminyldiphosphoundecaprenol N-acetyl-beta-D-mannosaminyltransferase
MVDLLAPRIRVRVLKAPIDVVTWQMALGRVHDWASRRESRYVCITNAHSAVTASQDESFQVVLEDADMVTADGAPIAWMLRRLGHPGQERINGPDLMWRYCEQAARSQESIYLYGGKAETLERLQKVLIQWFPCLQIAGVWAPPFRELTPEEDDAVVQRINDSGAGVVWVSLGCPKQERWIAAHRGRIHAVMVGVGAAFDYHAGILPRAPLWMQRCGLEWLHRLYTEPRRLWKRYLLTNFLFVTWAFRQLLTQGRQPEHKTSR